MVGSQIRFPYRIRFDLGLLGGGVGSRDSKKRPVESKAEMATPILWFLDQSHIIVTAVTGGTFLYTRSAPVAYFIIGSLVTNFAAKGIKLLLRQPRPVASKLSSSSLSAVPSTAPSDTHPSRKAIARLRTKQKKTYGMPSTHSTTVSFFMVYIVLALSSSNTPSRVGRYKGWYMLGTVIWGCAIIFSRVYLGYHTYPQILVGSGLGLLSAISWMQLWERAVQGEMEGRLQSLIDWGFSLTGL